MSERGNFGCHSEVGVLADEAVEIDVGDGQHRFLVRHDPTEDPQSLRWHSLNSTGGILTTRQTITGRLRPLGIIHLTVLAALDGLVAVLENDVGDAQVGCDERVEAIGVDRRLEFGEQTLH
jgi:hypothetical protein